MIARLRFRTVAVAPLVSLLLSVALIPSIGCEAAHDDGGPTAADVQTALEAAQAYIDADQLPAAIVILEQLIDHAPDDPRAHSALAQANLALAQTVQTAGGDPDAAAHAFGRAARAARRAADLAPDDASYQREAAGLAGLAGELEDAATLYERAAALDPGNPQYPIYRGSMLLRLGRRDAARAAFEHALAIDPDEPFAHASLAGVHLEERNWDAALERIADARRLAPDDLAIRLQEAKILRLSGTPETAYLRLIGLRETVRREAGVVRELAAASDAMGDPGRAAAHWMARYRQFPEDIEAGVEAGLALVRAGETEEAAILRRTLGRLAPQAPRLHDLDAAIAEATAADPAREG